MNNSSLLDSISILFSFSLTAVLFFIKKIAVISVFSEFPLIIFVSARSPSINPKASSSMDFPAPVSPVKTVIPDSKSRLSLLMIARSLMMSWANNFMCSSLIFHEGYEIDHVQGDGLI